MQGRAHPQNNYKMKLRKPTDCSIPCSILTRDQKPKDYLAQVWKTKILGVVKVVRKVTDFPSKRHKELVFP